MHCQNPYGVKESRFRHCKLLVTLTNVLISQVVGWLDTLTGFWNDSVDGMGVTLGLYRYDRTVSLLMEIYRRKKV